MSAPNTSTRKTFDRIFQWVDNFIYALIALFLIAAALFTLYAVFDSLLHFFEDKDLRHAIVVVIDRIMLALMVIEILYTVRISLQHHKLTPEPFLVVALIALIRRILVISVESGYLITFNQEGFLNLLIEIAVLGLLVVLFVGSMLMLQRQKLTYGREPEADLPSDEGDDT
jgi:uncharacterized membrane protein (DUF373 family)